MRVLRFKSLVAGLSMAAAVLLWQGPTAAGLVLQEDAPELVLVSAPASILGVKVADVDAHAAELLHLKSVNGVEVIVVDHDAPAGKAGIQLRDVILAIDGKAVADAQQFRETMGGYPPGRKVVLAVIRDGKPKTFTIRLADRAKLQQQAYARHFNPRMPSLGNSFGNVAAMQGMLPGERGAMGRGEELEDSPDMGLPSAFGFFGLGADLEPIGPQLASFFGVKDGAGMLVKSVEPGSPAAAAGLQAGDVVLRVNEAPIMNPIDWVRAIDSARGKPMPMMIVRNKHTETLTLPALPRTQALLGLCGGPDSTS